MNTTPKNEGSPKNQDGPKNEEDPKNEDEIFFCGISYPNKGYHRQPWNLTL